MSTIKQIAPEDWQPGNIVDIALISPKPNDLQVLCEIRFHQDTDDLDDFDVAYLQIPGGARYMLTKHKRTSELGTKVWADIQLERDYQLATLALVRVLGLDPAVILWVAERGTYNFLIQEPDEC